MVAKNYDTMTKEELIERIKKKNAQNNSYKWRKNITLTPAEGEILEKEFLPKYECANVSQFVKKIVKGELVVTKAD